MAGPGITFPNNAQWGAVNQEWAKEVARDPDVAPLALRVFFAANGWSNRIGHACFEPGGLREILTIVDRRTGALRQPKRQGVNRAIRHAKAMGLIDESSSARCLVLSGNAWQKRGKGNAVCSIHDVGLAGGHWSGAE